MTANGVGPLDMYREAVEARYGVGARYEVALTLMVAERRLVETINGTLKSHGLTRPQWSVLTILHLAPTAQIPLGQIASALDVHGTTITNAMDRLVDLGLADRVVDRNDRRSVLAQITTAGAELSDAILKQLATDQFGLAALSDTDLRSLARILRKIGSAA
jgi:DNA-binding MarR family transcriptional regulator